MIRLIIARHGNTFQPGEDPRRLGCREDPKLTAAGVTQANRLGCYLASLGWDIELIHAAPLRRSLQTATIVAKALAPVPQVSIELWLNEIDHGIDEGRRESEVIARIGSLALHEWDRTGRPPPGWRVNPLELEQAWRDAAARIAFGTHLFVTSNGIARFAVRALAGNAHTTSLKLRTGAFGVITLDHRGAKLERWDELLPHVFTS